MQTLIQRQSSSRLSAGSVLLSIEAIGKAEMSFGAISAARKETLASFPRALSPLFLRHSDDQTIVALKAVAEAMQGISPETLFADWAIVSCSRSLGRTAFAGVMQKYREEGPWGVSVQVIPNSTAHSVAGTISLALMSNGPCIGVGSHPGCDVEALYSFSSLLRRSDLAGGLIVLSGWSPELVLDSEGHSVTDSNCFAIALAVKEQASWNSIGQIRLNAPPHEAFGLPAVENPDDVESSDNLLEFLIRTGDAGGKWYRRASNSIGAEICVRPGWQANFRSPLVDQIAEIGQGG